MIKVAIVGLPSSGKTTIFNALTKGRAKNIGIVRIEDERLDYLHSLYPEKKKVSAEIELQDTLPFKEGAYKSLKLANMDGLVMVLKCFGEIIEPIREIKTILGELILADLMIIEKIVSSFKGKKTTLERGLIEKCRDSLENEIPIRKIGLCNEERRLLSSYQFLTDRPIVFVGNIEENKEEKALELQEYARINNEECVIVSGKLEMELQELEEKERSLFLKELGIEEALPSLIKAIYKSLDFVSFFTIGKDEVRLWPIKKGTNALKAAGKIHSDMEKGFIRASVVSYKDFLENQGSFSRLKEKGLLKLEGKDYVVSDGDIIEFRFNI